MASELVDLNRHLKKPLLTWLQIFSQHGDNQELDDLHDGVFLEKVWREINDLKDDQTPKNQTSTPCREHETKEQIDQQKPNKNCIRRIKNLNNLLVNLKKFYEQTLGQLLVLRMPDIFRIACSTDQLAKQDLNTLILLLLGSAVQCDRKEIEIERIKQLDLDDQHELVECIQQITDNPISVWSINEWSELSLLEPSEHEKMFSLLYMHVQSLIQERDQLLARLVSIVLRIENLSKQCNCGQQTNSELDEMLDFLNFSTHSDPNGQQANQVNYSIINNISLNNLTINQSFATPSKASLVNKLECSLLSSNLLNNKSQCSNCRSLMNDSTKLDKKSELEDSSLTSLPSLTKEDEDTSERGVKLRQTIEELNELKQKLRTVQTELEEKTEMSAELKELLEQSKDTNVRLREENIELAQEAKKMKAYRDEIDILNEKVRTSHHMENELEKYKLKMNDYDFYKARVDELRDENRLLNDAKQMLDEQLEISRKKSENLSEVESQLYQMKAYSSELKAQRELDKDKIQSLIEQIAELQVEKKATIEELSVCQSELKHLRSQLNNNQIYLTDYASKDVKTTKANTSNEENSIESMNTTLVDNEQNLRSSLKEQLNSDASKRILKLELENQKLQFIIENLRASNATSDTNETNGMNNAGNEKVKHSSICSLGSVHSVESNGKVRNHAINDRLGERCSSNSSTDSIKSTSLSVFSSATGELNNNLPSNNSSTVHQTNASQYSTSTSPLDTNEYDSGCVSLVCENSNKSNSITPVNMLRMQQQQQQLDKERFEEQMFSLKSVNDCDDSHKANNSPIKQSPVNEFNSTLSYQLNGQSQSNRLLLNNANKCLNSTNYRSSSESSNDELTKLHRFNGGSNSSLSSNASSVGLKQQFGRCKQSDLNKLNNNYLSKISSQSSTSYTNNDGNLISTTAVTSSPAISRPSYKETTNDQIKQIDLKRMPLIETSQIERELDTESYSSVSYLHSTNDLKLKQTMSSINSPINKSTSSSISSQATNQQLTRSPPPKLPPRNPISSSCSSSSNSPLTLHTNNKQQLTNGKLATNRNDLNGTKSTIENRIAFNFMTKSSCTVNNSIMNSNTCTIRQTTSTYNRPTTFMLKGSNMSASPNTGYSSSIITTTTTQCLNNQRKFNESDLSKSNLVNGNDVYCTGISNNNFVRGVFRSCNNFGPNFKGQKFITSTNASKATALNNSLNSKNCTNEIDPMFNESQSAKKSKLINKAIQQNGYIFKQVKTNQTPTKNDHKITNDVTTSNFNYLTNSVSSPSLNSSESDEDDEEEETELSKSVKHTKGSPNKLNTNHLLHNANLKASMQVYPPCPLQRSKTLMLNSNGKPESNRIALTRPQRIEITTTHHPTNCPKNRSLVSSPVSSTVSTKSVWMEYGCV